MIQASLEGIVYFKIGLTSRTGKKRAQDLFTSNPSDLSVLAEYETPHAALLEQCLLKHYRRFRIKGEWFSEASELNHTSFLEMCEKYNSNLMLLAKDNEYFKTKILKK